MVLKHFSKHLDKSDDLKSDNLKAEDIMGLIDLDEED